MEDNIKSAFESVHMSEDCAEFILTEMNHRSAPVKYASFGFWRTVSVMATALALVMLIVVGNADAVEALTANFTKPTEPRYYSSEYYYVDIKKKDNSLSNALMIAVTVRDGRLYFVANGENIDITDAFSNDEPYEYFFMDDNGFMNYIAIGGEFGGTKESLKNVGYMYHMWYPDLNGDGIYNDGGAGGGRHHWNNETNDYFGWHIIAEETWKSFSHTPRDTE